MRRKTKEITPRNGYMLMVLIVARISGCSRQKEMSLEDQVDHGREVLAEEYTGPTQFKTITTKGKGEWKDRPELAQLEALLRSGIYDVLFVEDLGRIIRGADAVRLLGIAVDHGVRAISPNDCLDTDDPTWEEDALGACRDHVGHNAHTSKRIKQKTMNRFLKQGGVPALPIYGYIVPPGCKHYGDWLVDETAREIYREWFQMLLKGVSFSRVADWLNSRSVPTGPYAHKKEWDGKMVARITKNSLVKGMPGRGHRMTVKHHEDGHRITQVNPEGANYITVPHLALVPEVLWNEVNALIRELTAGMGRKPVAGRDPRLGVSKKKTIFPGQQLVCGVCGRWFYWGGHGQSERMMCSGVHNYQCWSASTFDGVAAGPKLVKGFLDCVEALPDFDEQFLEEMHRAADESHGNRDQKLKAVDQQFATCSREVDNLTDAVARMGYSTALEDRLKAAEATRIRLLSERARIAGESDEVPDLPPIAEIKRLARQHIDELKLDDWEFCAAMRTLMPRITVHPYQPRDGGHIVYRAVAEVNLAPLLGEGNRWVDKQLCRSFMVDLFERPQRIEYMERIAEKRAAGWLEHRIANEYDLTITATQRATALYRVMKAAGSDDPYVLVTVPPEEGRKLQRHRHPRYRFQPLEGYPSMPRII